MSVGGRFAHREHRKRAAVNKGSLFAHRRQRKTAAVSRGGLFAPRGQYKKVVVSSEDRLAHRENFGISVKTVGIVIDLVTYAAIESVGRNSSYRGIRSDVLNRPCKCNGVTLADPVMEVASRISDFSFSQKERQIKVKTCKMMRWIAWLSII